MQNIFAVKHFNILSEASQYLTRNRVGSSSHSSRNTDVFVAGVADDSAGFKVAGIHTHIHTYLYIRVFIGETHVPLTCNLT